MPVGSADSTATTVIEMGELGVANKLYSPSSGGGAMKSGVADRSGVGRKISVTAGVLVGTTPSVVESSGLGLTSETVVGALVENTISTGTSVIETGGLEIGSSESWVGELMANFGVAESSRAEPMKAVAVGVFVGAAVVVTKSGVVDSSGPVVIANAVTEVPVRSAISTEAWVIAKGELRVADDVGSIVSGIGVIVIK